MKKMVSRILFLSLILSMSILAGCGTEKDAAWEKEKKEAIEKYLAQAPNLKHGEISVGAKDKSFTINNLANVIIFANGEGETVFVADFAIDKIHAQGVNFSDTKGVVDLVDKVTVSNMTYTITYDKDFWKKMTKGEQPDPGSAVAVIGEIVLEKVRDDIDVALRSMILEKISLKEMSTYKNAHIGKLIMKKMALSYLGASDSVVKHQVDELFINDVSLEHVGEGRAKNYLTEVDDKRIFFVEELGGKEISFLGGLSLSKDLNYFKKFLEQKIIFDGCYAKNIVIMDPVEGFTIKEISGSLIKKAADFTFKFGVKEAFLPSVIIPHFDEDTRFLEEIIASYNKPSFFSGEFAISGNIKGADDLAIDEVVFNISNSYYGSSKGLFIKKGTAFRMEVDVKDCLVSIPIVDFVGAAVGIEKFSDIYNSPLLISWGLAMSGNVKGDYNLIVDEIAFSLSESNLGSIKNLGQFGGDGMILKRDVPLTDKSICLKQFSTTMTDTGIIDLGFALAASSRGSSGAKAAGKLLRAQTARAVTNMCLNEAGANIQSLCTAIGGFLAAPGILDISLNPEELMCLNKNMENIDDATKLGLKATFTLGK